MDGSEVVSFKTRKSRGSPLSWNSSQLINWAHKCLNRFKSLSTSKRSIYGLHGSGENWGKRTWTFIISVEEIWWLASSWRQLEWSKLQMVFIYYYLRMFHKIHRSPCVQNTLGVFRSFLQRSLSNDNSFLYHILNIFYNFLSGMSWFICSEKVVTALIIYLISPSLPIWKIQLGELFILINLISDLVENTWWKVSKKKMLGIISITWKKQPFFWERTQPELNRS